MKIDLDELKLKAEAATPGLWTRGSWRLQDIPAPDPSDHADKEQWNRKVEAWRQLPRVLVVNNQIAGEISALSGESVVSGCGCCGSPDASAEDATHIAAASPATMLALIGRIRELETALVEDGNALRVEDDLDGRPDEERAWRATRGGGCWRSSRKA
jgi:hypothetical protein